MEIVEVDSIGGIKAALISLLKDSVDNGASVGFLPPLQEEDAEAYWRGIEAELAGGDRRLWVAFDQHHLVGAVQLALCTKANGRHRAEVEKLLVQSQTRRQGVGRALMHAMEQGARDTGRSLLVLDTRVGDVAATLYRRLGYQEAGQIPNFARNSDGTLDATQFFYKQL